jgi:RNA polymerase sigma-70 factor (ECF subfamily)
VGEPDLEEALRDARRGDEWAITLLVRSIQPGLLRYLQRKAPAAAEDLASETWLAAAQQLAHFEGSFAAFRALVFTIARRRAVDHYRRLGRHLVEVPLDEVPLDEAEGKGAPVLDAAEIAVERLSSREAIDALVRALPPAQAEVVLLRVVADLSVDEVAQVLGRSPGAVRILQHRALRKLERQLGMKTVTR